MFEKSGFESKLSKNLDLGKYCPEISISVKIIESISIFVQILEKSWFQTKFQKKSRFQSKFMKKTRFFLIISIIVYIFDKSALRWILKKNVVLIIIFEKYPF